ncbi:MAG TPA: dienelactone hydrolase family protein, partial [Nakamurella sp.]
YRGGHKLRCMFAAIRDIRARRGRTFDDIDTVRTWLADRADCAGPIGIIGFCMGGGFVLMLAPTHRYTAGSVNYGTAGKDVLSLDYLSGTCPIVGSYGAKDRGNRGAAPRLETTAHRPRRRPRHQGIPRRGTLLPQRPRSRRRSRGVRRARQTQRLNLP